VLTRIKARLGPMPNSKKHLRRSFSHFLRGAGIEIGALHQPLDLKGLPISQIRYVDRMEVSELRRHYSELSGYQFVPVHVLDDGETLATFADASLDFIIVNHFIEHTHNPIGTLRNWLAKLRPSGIIFMAVPDKRRTFDAERPLTPLDHLAADDAQAPSEREPCDYDHYLEYARLVDKQIGAQTELHAQRLIATNYSIHFHTFVAATFAEMLRYAQEQCALPFEIAAYADTLPESDEFLFILRKKP
jgi:SAM-dependent methyltransferase